MEMISHHRNPTWRINVVVVVTSLLGCLSVTIPFAAVADAAAADDPHGGVPMGVRNHFCDDGRNFTSLDWSPKDTDVYTCDERTYRSTDMEHKRDFHCEEIAQRPIHVCFPEMIIYNEDLPTSGRHRPLWPKYGEYTYVPVQRWLHSLEHGSIVFLYHPCADPGLVEQFKSIAKHCIRRHIISPYKKLPVGMNFAVLSWTCKLVLSHPSLPSIVQFVKGHALKAPERGVYGDGQYDLGLKNRAAIVSDLQESELCPNMDMLRPTLERIIEASKIRRRKHMSSRHRLQQLNKKIAGLSRRRS